MELPVGNDVQGDRAYKYQASYFSPAADIEPSPTVIVKLVQAFYAKGLELIPTTSVEMTSTGMQQRLAFQSAKLGLDVAINGGRIDVVRGDTANPGEPSAIGSLEEFSEFSSLVFGVILKEFPRKASRFGFVTNVMLRPLSEKKMAEAYLKFANPYGVFSEVSPFEWSIRSASRMQKKFGNKTEECFSICNVSRSSLQLFKTGVVGVSMERIVVESDFNTVPSVDLRFSLKDWAAFSKHALDGTNRLQSSVLERLEL